MQLTAGEKLILIMLSDIKDHLQIQTKREISSDLVKHAIVYDQLWALDWEYGGMLGVETSDKDKQVHFVCDVLDMFGDVEHSIKNLSPEENDELKHSAKFSSELKFKGFDGNNETKFMLITNTLIEELGRYTEFKDRSYNSHQQMVGSYTSMLRAYTLIKSKPEHEYAELELSDLKELLQAFESGY